MGKAFFIGPEQTKKLSALRELAIQNPIDVRAVLELVKTPEGLDQHLTRMENLTVEIPIGYTVTFSIDLGHPIGTCRHMSMSSSTKGSVPIPEAIWMVAKELGFTGDIIFEGCTIYLEKTPGRKEAINIIQSVDIYYEGKG